METSRSRAFELAPMGNDSDHPALHTPTFGRHEHQNSIGGASRASAEGAEKVPAQTLGSDLDYDDDDDDDDDDEPKDRVPGHKTAELDPQRWAGRHKWRQVVIVSLLALVTPLASAVYTPALDQVSHDLSVSSPSLLHLSVSAYIFGFAAGPLLVWPLSGRVGRLPIFRTGSACLALLNLLCAFVGSIHVLIVLRFLAGIAGCTPMALGPATIVDLFRKEERGKALSLMAAGAVGGPVLGPALGGFVAQSVGWRGCFLVLACVNSFNAILTLVWMRETSLEVIQKHHGESVGHEVEASSLLHKPEPSQAPEKAVETSWESKLRSMASSLRLDISAAAALGSFFYCIQVWLYIDIPVTYKAAYDFSVRSSGAVFIGLGIGMVVGLLVFGLFGEKFIERLARGQDRLPEHRLPLLAGSMLLFALGMGIYTLGTKLALMWLIPAAGNTIMGVGLFVISMSISAYVLDASPKNAVAFAAALSVSRFSTGAVFPVLAHKLETWTSHEAFKWSLTAASVAMTICVLVWARAVLIPRWTKLPSQRRNSVSDFS